MTSLQFPAVPPRADGILLRRFMDADIDMLRDLATDPYLPLIGSLPANASRQEAAAFIARQHQRLETGAGYSFCVADTSGAALGSAGLWVAALTQGRATIGYSVAPFARGRGVAVRALRAMTEFAWTIPELCRIELYIEPWNLASIRVAEAGGYVQEGLLHSHQPIGDRRADMLLYATLRPTGGS